MIRAPGPSDDPYTLEMNAYKFYLESLVYRESFGPYGGSMRQWERNLLYTLANAALANAIGYASK